MLASPQKFWKEPAPHRAGKRGRSMQDAIERAQAARRGRIARRLRHLAVLLQAALSAACSAGHEGRLPAFPFAAHFAGAPQGAPVLLSNAEWWHGLGDPALDRLVTRALAGSLDLARARERLTEAAALRQTVTGGGNLGPGSAGLALEGRAGAEGGRYSETATATLSLSWLLDPYGGRQARIRGAEARIAAAAAETDAARLALLRAICRGYVDLRYYQNLLALRQEEQGRRRSLLEAALRLEENGAASRIDVTRARARLAETEAQIPALQAQIAVQQNQLAVLAGGGAGLPGLGAGRGQPQPRMPANVGIPADLLRNRPDIRIAEQGYYAALADLDAADADRWPRLSLSGTIGQLSPGGGSYAFGPALQVPELFSTQPGARAAQRASLARQAQLDWKATTLGAIAEVENQLALYGAAVASTAASERAARLYREAARLTDAALLQEGSTLTARLEAEDDLAEAQQALAATRRDLGLGFVELNVALGSGNAGPAAPTAAPAPTAAAPTPASAAPARAAAPGPGGAGPVAAP